jgi:hypothetical protein
MRERQSNDASASAAGPRLVASKVQEKLRERHVQHGWFPSHFVRSLRQRLHAFFACTLAGGMRLTLIDFD